MANRRIAALKKEIKKAQAKDHAGAKRKTLARAAAKKATTKKRPTLRTVDPPREERPANEGASFTGTLIGIGDVSDEMRELIASADAPSIVLRTDNGIVGIRGLTRETCKHVARAMLHGRVRVALSVEEV